MFELIERLGKNLEELCDGGRALVQGHRRGALRALAQRAARDGRARPPGEARAGVPPHRGRLLGAARAVLGPAPPARRPAPVARGGLPAERRLAARRARLDHGGGVDRRHPARRRPERAGDPRGRTQVARRGAEEGAPPVPRRHRRASRHPRPHALAVEGGDGPPGAHERDAGARARDRFARERLRRRVRARAQRRPRRGAGALLFREQDLRRRALCGGRGGRLRLRELPPDRGAAHRADAGRHPPRRLGGEARGGPDRARARRARRLRDGQRRRHGAAAAPRRAPGPAPAPPAPCGDSPACSCWR